MDTLAARADFAIAQRPETAPLAIAEAFEAAVRMRDRFLQQEVWDRMGIDPKVAAVAAGSFREKEPPTIQGSGYVVQSLDRQAGASRREASSRDRSIATAAA